MIDVSMLNTMQVTDQRLQKEECGLDEKELLRQLQKQRAGALEQAVAQYAHTFWPSSATAAAAF